MGKQRQRRGPVARWPHTLGLRVDSETMAALERLADRDDVPLSEIARDVLRRGLGLTGRKGRAS